MDNSAICHRCGSHIVRRIARRGRNTEIRFGLLIGQTYFDDMVTINLELQPSLKACFDSLLPDRIIQMIEIETQKSIIAGKTLLFIDEIQECPSAIESLRYFKEKRRSSKLTQSYP